MIPKKKMENDNMCPWAHVKEFKIEINVLKVVHSTF